MQIQEKHIKFDGIKIIINPMNNKDGVDSYFFIQEDFVGVTFNRIDAADLMLVNLTKETLDYTNGKVDGEYPRGDDDVTSFVCSEGAKDAILAFVKARLETMVTEHKQKRVFFGEQIEKHTAMAVEVDQMLQ